MRMRSWGEVRPVRNCESEARGECVSLLVPRFGRGAFGRLMDRWLRLGPMRVHLDDVGTFVWSRCDGIRTAAAIAAAMRAELGERVEPAESRLATILAEAEADMRTQLGAELERLESLQKVNPSIRDEEIEHMRYRIEECAIHIQHANLQLQALRLIITN